MQQFNTLIRTKFHQPFIRPGLVTRPRLQAKIIEGLLGPLTLVIAPAGFGKTTLIASSLAGCDTSVAWLSLDRDDNQLGRFLTYIIAAFQDIDKRIGGEAAQLLAGMDQAHAEAVMTSLINDLDTANGELTLVLDDYQLISIPEVHAAIAFLLDHCPQAFHLVIATRSDPPLPLARLRARGQLVEIRAADLRFTEPEADQFLNEVMGLRLDAGSVAVLEERTEGWVAGLQMAALSVRDRKDVRGFIEAFSGTNRYILDYMLEEVLTSQPSEIQHFLLYTSILKRLTAPLCDAVLENKAGSKNEGDDRSPPSESHFLRQSVSILEYLEKANLFLASLDDERIWYRYHHLFADLLHNRLDQLYPGMSPRLHALAAGWYETNGFYEEAIHHVLAARDYPEAARLVEAIAENAWLNGQYASILTWTKAIPVELVRSHPWLCVWNAWATTQMGVSQAVDQWITAAEQATINQYGDMPSAALEVDQDVQALMNEIAALRAFSVSFSQDYERAIELAEAVLKNPPLKNKRVTQFTRCNLLHLLSSMHFATGFLLQAEQTCQETIKLATEMGFAVRLLNATNKIILIHTANGHLYRSHQLIEETLSLLEKQGFHNHFAFLQLHCRKMELLYEWNQLQEFQRQVELALNPKVLADIPYLWVETYNILALNLLTKQDYNGSQEALNKARTIARQTYIYEGLTWRTETLQTRLWLKKGDLSLAEAWRASQPVGDQGELLRFPDETRSLSLVRILLAQGANQDALSLLDRLSASAEAEGRKGSLIVIHTLTAIAFLGIKKRGQAVTEIKRALMLAEPEGYVRTFLDEGPPILTLLSQVASDDSSPPTKYVLRLLDALREEQETTKLYNWPVALDDGTPSFPGAPNAALVEPLSGRELEVLHLLAQGKTNQEIARQLFVATGTVKAHAASIYRKLEVTNRTEAVARARQLGILA